MIRVNKDCNLVKSEVCLITKSYYNFDIICWVDHYLNWCGFDHVTIYDNDTSCCNISECFKNDDKVTVYKISDKELSNTIQTNLYIKHAKNSNYEWIFFCDDDEYLWFNKLKYKTINNFISILQTKNIDCFIIPWLMVSYEAYKAPLNRTRSMKYDCSFTDCGLNDINKAVYKPLVKNNFKDIEFFTTHFISNKKNYYNLTNYYTNNDVNGKNETNTIVPLISYTIKTSDILLPHYHIRSINEWNMKMERRRIDLWNNIKNKDDVSCTASNEFNNSTYLNYIKLFN